MGRLEELRKWDDLASKAPWTINCDGPVPIIRSELSDYTVCKPYLCADLELIVAARNALPALLAVAEAARIPDEEQLVPDDDERAPGWVLVPRERLKALREALDALGGGQ